MSETGVAIAQTANYALGNATGDIDPALERLMAAAGNLAGLDLLLLMGRDPATCDTECGFAMRLHHSIPEVRRALLSLHDSGILGCSSRPARAHQLCYWLRQDGPNMSALLRLVETYMSGPRARCGLLRVLAAA